MSKTRKEARAQLRVPSCTCRTDECSYDSAYEAAMQKAEMGLVCSYRSTGVPWLIPYFGGGLPPTGCIIPNPIFLVNPKFQNLCVFQK